MSKLIIAITGPAGSGKSTVAAKLSKQIEKCVNIDVDHVKHFIVSGFIYGETAEGVEQWELLGKNIGMLAKNFEESGYSIIINGYLNEPAWHEINKSIEFTHKFLLLPSLEAIKSRDKQRKEEFMLGDKAVAKHHIYFSSSDFYNDFIKLDSTDETIDVTTDRIEQRLSK